ncbi:transposase, partial [Roseomonas sp. GCM10028921]
MWGRLCQRAFGNFIACCWGGHAARAATIWLACAPYPISSDLSDAEWAILCPLLTRARQAGHRQVLDLRRIVEAVFYLLRTG